MSRFDLGDGRARVTEDIWTPANTLQRERGRVVTSITGKINLHVSVGYDDAGDVR